MSKSEKHPVLNHIVNTLQTAIADSKVENPSSNEFIIKDGNDEIHLIEVQSADKNSVTVLITDKRRIIFSEDLLETLQDIHEQVKGNPELKTALEKASIIINELNIETEFVFQAIKDFFPKIGFKLLLNASEVILHNNQHIAIIGVEDWGKPPFKQYGDLQKALHKVTDIPLQILLSHDPTHWTQEVVNHTNITLTLAGHTHGMQAGIDLGNLKWSPIQYKLKHWAGLYQVKNQYLYVNRGLGWLGFPGRIGMPPEITFLELE